MEHNEHPTYNQSPQRRGAGAHSAQPQQRRAQTGAQQPVRRQARTGQQQRIQTGSQQAVRQQSYDGQAGTQRVIEQRSRTGQQQRVSQTGSQEPVQRQRTGQQRRVAQTESQRPIQQRRPQTGEYYPVQQQEQMEHAASYRQVQRRPRTGQQRRVAPQQRSNGAHSRQQYSRDAYAVQRRQANRQRRSGIYTEQPRSRGGGFPLPIWVIGAIAAVVIILLVIVINPFGAKGTGGQQQGTTNVAVGGTGATGAAAQTAALPTPIMAESAGIQLHSAVAMKDLTEVLIHNASYSYANEITTQLAEATNTDVIAKHGTGRVASTQPTGDQWMTGEFIRCYRDGNAGPTMSAIDCGGPVGATVYAPVTGTVVLAKDYELYDMYDDVQVHIQPDGRSDLDVVLIHLQNVTVKNGDRVEAGVTPIGQIRDVFEYIGDSMQLKQYTAVADNGNHTHIQVNNANDPAYHGLDDIKPAPAPAADTAAQPA